MRFGSLTNLLGSKSLAILFGRDGNLPLELSWHRFEAELAEEEAEALRAADDGCLMRGELVGARMLHDEKLEKHAAIKRRNPDLT